MKKALSLVLTYVVFLILCSCTVQETPMETNCTHNWQPATCEQPAICKLCGLSQGAPYGHQWQDATCTSAQTCNICRATIGTPKAHEWQDATCTSAQKCSICGTTTGTAKGHQWKDATCQVPQTCTVCGTTHGNVGKHSENSQGKCQYCGVDIFLLNVQNNLTMKLIVPSVGSSKNYYCQVLFVNQTGYEFEIPVHIYPNGKSCVNLQASDQILPSGYQWDWTYYRSIIAADRYQEKYKDMYLDNESLAWTIIWFNDTKVYVKFGTEGIVMVGYTAAEIEEY